MEKKKGRGLGLTLFFKKNFLILEILQCSYYVIYILVMLSSYYTKVSFFYPLKKLVEMFFE